MHSIPSLLLATTLFTHSGSTALQESASARDDYVLREAWVGELHLGPIKAVMQFRIEANVAGATRAFFDSVSEKRTDFDAQWRIEGEELAFDVAEVGATFRGELDAAHEHAQGRFKQGGRELPLTLERRAKAYEPKYTWETRPQRPKAPFPYSSHEVTFANERDGCTLAGTLTLPQGDGRFPAVILVSGSGPQDRDETLFEHKPFLVLADHLSRRGFAVLRCDDRGTAGSTGKFSSATTEDFARDAEAALDFLRKHERIDPARIGLIGHSEGGLIVPLVAAARREVAALVLLAGPGVPGSTIVREQATSIARAEGASDAQLRLQEAVIDAVLRSVGTAAADAQLETDISAAVAEAVAKLPEAERELAREGRDAFRAQLSSFTSPWFRFFVRHDPLPVLRRVHCPVLALSGSKDVQVVPVSTNLAGIERALTEGGNTDHEARELPGLNHMFQTCERGAISEFVSIQETLAPVALETIERWLAQRLIRSERR